VDTDCGVSDVEGWLDEIGSMPLRCVRVRVYVREGWSVVSE
jgi:hypothetical protein